MDVAKVKQVWVEMSPEERDSYANSLSDEQFGQLKSALSVKQESQDTALAPAADKTDIHAQQQEIVDRMSGIPEILGQDVPDGTGETLGQFVKRPEVLRTGLELGGMVAGGAFAAPVGIALAATRLPRLAATLRGITAPQLGTLKHPLLTETAVRGTGAGLGGGAGSLAAEPIAPSVNPLESAAIAGGIGLAGEGAGGLLTKGFQALLRPKAKEGAATVQDLMQARGGTLSASQAVEPGVISTLEDIGRSGFAGKPIFQRLDQTNQAALQSAKKDIIESVSKNLPSDKKIGDIFQEAILAGKTEHAAQSKVMYENFDKKASLVKKVKTETPEESVILDASGRAIPQITVKTSKRPVYLVDATAVSQFADKTISLLGRIGNVGKTERGGQLISQLSQIKKEMSFADAHELRSSLLSTIRDLRASGEESRALKFASEAVSNLDKAMETSASKLAPDLYKEYRAISVFYKKGKEAFSNDIVSALLKEKPSKLGEHLFRSNAVEDIIQVKASLRQAEKLDPSVKAVETFQKIKAGYLEAKFTAKGATNIEGETVGHNLIKDLAVRKTDRVFNATFNEGERRSIQQFARASLLATRTPDSQFGVVTKLIQAGALGDAITFRFNNPGADVAIAITPYVLARMLTNPKNVRYLIGGMRTQSSSAKAVGLATKISAEMQNIESEREK